VERGLGCVVDVIERLTARLLASDVPLRRDALLAEGARLLPEEAPLAGGEAVVDAVDALVGLGPVERLLRRPDVSDVLVNGPDEIWIERGGVLEPAPIRFRDSAAIEAAVQRVIAPLGLRLDRASPAVDARLADGSRLHALIPPAAVDGPMFAVRRFTEAVPDVGALVAAGSIDDSGAAVLRDAVARRSNLVVAGGTGTGKTTLLNVLSKEIPPQQRVVTIEDAAELRLTGHVVRLEARPPNAEGAGEITVRSLLKHALRLRPDRIVVGEVRGPEALDMVQALSSGHAGSMSTVHAEDAEQAMLRLAALAMSAGEADARVVRRLLHAAIDLIVVVARRDGRRFTAAIVAVGPSGIDEVWRC
jgi:pilus assembly protein CpaF